MNKIGIHIFVQSPDVCLSVREVRIMHFVALKNDTPDNFEQRKYSDEEMKEIEKALLDLN